VLRAVRTNWQKLRRAWDDANLNTPLKILILVGGLFLAVSNAGILLPLAVVLCAAYGAYRIVRAFAKDGKQIAADSRGQTAPGESNSRGQTAPGGSPENIAGANGAPTGGRCPPAIVLGDAVGGSDPKAMDGIDTTPLPGRAVAEPKHRACRSWLEKPLPALVVKPPRERLAELLGSMLLSALVAAVACVVVVLVESYCAGSLGAPREEQIAWLLLTSIAGAWAVLIPSKSWEGTRGEPIVRRLTMMVVGMLLGLASFAAAQLFLVDLPPAAGYPQSTDYALPPQFYAAGGKPLAMAYMAAFGTLFLVMRWWRQADPLRRTRLSLWTLFVVAIVSGAAAYAWQFPQPWLPMAAVTISAAVQLSSPWTHPKRRRH